MHEEIACHAVRSTRRGRFVSGALTTVLFVLALAFGLGTTSAQARDYTFQSFKIEGSQRIESGTVMSYVGIKRGQTVSDSDLNAAYRRLTDSGLFENVKLEPRGSTLVVKVQELPIINVISFEGNRRYKDDALARVISSKARHIYSPAKAEADAATLADFYRQNGRYAATVTPKIIKRSDNRVDLVFEIQEGRVTEVRRLSFVGNQAYSDWRLRQVLATKQAGLFHQLIQSDTYVQQRIAEDKQKLKQFYAARGYIDFQVLNVASQLIRNRSGFFLTFTLHEGLPYAFGKSTVASDIPGVDLAPFKAALRSKPGHSFNSEWVKRNVERLENLATEKGMTFVKVDPVITRHRRAQTVDIAYTLKRTPRMFVQRIDITGNTTTLDRVIRRQFHTAEGDPYDPRKIEAAVRRIRALGFFSSVEAQAKPGTRKDEVIIDVNVTEKPTGSLSFGVSYGAATGAGVAAAFSESNFLGRGQYLRFAINHGVSNANSALTFTEPALLGRDVRLSTSLFYDTQKHLNSYFDTKQAGLNLGVQFPVSLNGRLGVHYKLSNDSVENVDVNSSPVLKAEVGSKVSSIVGYDYSYDTRTTGLNPNAGVLLKFGQEFSGLGGTTRYIESTGQILAQTKIAREQVTLKAGLKGGLLSMLRGHSRAVDRFFGLGEIIGFKPNGIGPRDLGAINQDPLGGNKYAVFSVEADFPLGLPSEYNISGGVFWNTGAVWGLNSSEYGLLNAAAQETTKIHLRSAVGFSIFWTTPIGPLRLNFSHALKKMPYDQVQNFDLTISTQF